MWKPTDAENLKPLHAADWREVLLSRQGNGFCSRSLGPMDRVFLTIICAGIVLLVTALALGTPRTNSGGLTTGLYQRVLPR